MTRRTRESNCPSQASHHLALSGNDTLREMATALVEEFEDSHVHDSVLPDAHFVAGPRHQFASEIRDQATRPVQSLSRVADDFVVADEQQRRYVQGA